jgi:hypothetical protein
MIFNVTPQEKVTWSKVGWPGRRGNKCSPENAMFEHHCLLAEKRGTTSSHLSRKNFYISSIRWHAFISYMWGCYCKAKPLNPGWTYETRCIKNTLVLHYTDTSWRTNFQVGQLHTYEILKRKKFVIITNFKSAQWDGGGGRILLGDITSGWEAMLQPIRFQCVGV